MFHYSVFIAFLTITASFCVADDTIEFGTSVDNQFEIDTLTQASAITTDYVNHTIKFTWDGNDDQIYTFLILQVNEVSLQFYKIQIHITTNYFFY